MTINGGTLQITAKAQSLDPTGSSVVSSIAISSGKLDLANNAAIVDWSTSSPIGSIKQQIQSGAITSSMLDANHSIGFGEASALGVGSFGGTNVDTSAVLLRATVNGDANLDGVVNSLDFMSLANNFGQSGQYWNNGDFNGDGVVNALDFNVLASHFGQTMSTPALGQLVPEPSVFAMLGIASAFVARRRPRKR